MKANAADYCIREIMKGIEKILSDEVDAIFREDNRIDEVSIFPMKNAADLRNADISCLFAVRYPVLVYSGENTYDRRKVG